jgi:twitching motility two-component system response regulator PilH
MALVLIVDDSPTEVHVLGGYLKKHGFEIATAADGREGIDRARELKPDLVLMDVVMPGMNGFQATRQMSKDPEIASIPVIMVTTKGLETDKIWGMRQGAADYLVKPVTEAQLVEKVRAALARDD